MIPLEGKTRPDPGDVVIDRLFFSSERPTVIIIVSPVPGDLGHGASAGRWYDALLPSGSLSRTLL